jgi:hypothetical protein
MTRRLLIIHDKALPSALQMLWPCFQHSLEATARHDPEPGSGFQAQFDEIYQ